MARKSTTRKSSKSRPVKKSTKGERSGARSGRKTERKKTREHRRPVVRFSPEVRQQALALILRRVPRAKIAQEIGCSTETLRLWARAAEKELATSGGGVSDADTGAKPAAETEAAATAPKDPGAGLCEAEVSRSVIETVDDLALHSKSPASPP